MKFLSRTEILLPIQLCDLQVGKDDNHTPTPFSAICSTFHPIPISHLIPVFLLIPTFCGLSAEYKAYPL